MGSAGLQVSVTASPALSSQRGSSRNHRRVRRVTGTAERGPQLTYLYSRDPGALYSGRSTLCTHLIAQRVWQAGWSHSLGLTGAGPAVSTALLGPPGRSGLRKELDSSGVTFLLSDSVVFQVLPSGGLKSSLPVLGNSLALLMVLLHFFTHRAASCSWASLSTNGV